MAIEYTWAVVTTDFTVDPTTGAPTAVTTYHWTCTASEGEASESSYGTVGVPEGDPAASIPTSDADAVTKLLTLVDQADIEQALADRFTAVANPTTGSGKLWEFPADAAAWRAGVAYNVGDKVIFEGMSYNVIQAHTSQSDWRPPLVPALFEVFRVPTGGGVLPWAAGEAVEVGDQRTFEGSTYEVIQAHTTQAGWEPPNVPALWSVV